MADHSIGVGKGCMKVGLVGPQCFVLFWQYFPGKVLLRRRWVCFIRYAFEFLWSWMQPEGMEFVQRSLPRENSWSMQFVETKKVRSRSPRKLKFVRYILRLADLTKSVKWRAYVMSGGVSTRLHAQYLPQGKEKLLLRDILCLKRRSCLPLPALYSDWIARRKYYGGITKQMNFNYPRRWNQWKHWAKCRRLGAKCDRLHIF